MTALRMMLIGAVLQVAGHALGQAAGPGAPAGAADRPLQAATASFDVKAKPELEVKKAKTGHLLVRPTVNGHAGGWFIFDSGAGICVAAKDVVDELELSQQGEVDAVGGGGQQTATTYIAKELRLGPIALSGVAFIRADLAFLEPFLGEKINGVIGFGLLSRCVAVIDVDAPAISLLDPATYRLERGEWTPVDLSGQVPVVQGTFEGHEGRFLLDTGSHSQLIFNAPAVKKWNLLEGRTLKDGKLGGVGGFVASKNGEIATFEFAGRKFEKLEASFALEAKGTHARDDRTGTIGGGALGQFTLVLDYGHQRMALLDKPKSAAEAK